ncbi:hypothetical protein [Streptomyces sp. NPDC050422]|uniref:hypothetical protein n=1 Tax=Streptomyces sp. NPDC050422 TaxID=3365614 RepID=UPI00379C2352
MPVAHYFADLRAMAAMVFLTWPVAREYTGTPQLAAALDREFDHRHARALPMMSAAGKRHSSRPYSAPPTDSFTTGAVLGAAARLLEAADPAEARTQLAPIVTRLRRTNLALSAYMRRPAWISPALRVAVKDQ